MKPEIVLTKEENLSAEFVALCKSVQSKRPRTVIEHILKHGIITNEELSELYGYDHQPRAARDVRENGIPLVTHSIISPKTGRRVGAYTFGDLANIKHGRIGGRKAFSKKFKKELIERYGERDAITGDALNERYLQIDHRIPYEVAGEEASLEVENFMLLDASSQRAKSWSCEHCPNFVGELNPDVCRRCFWAFPENYDHIATEQKRRVDLVWTGEEVRDFLSLQERSKALGLDLKSYIKRVLSK